MKLNNGHVFHNNWAWNKKIIQILRHIVFNNNNNCFISFCRSCLIYFFITRNKYLSHINGMPHKLNTKFFFYLEMPLLQSFVSIETLIMVTIQEKRNEIYKFMCFRKAIKVFWICCVLRKTVIFVESEKSYVTTTLNRLH